MPLHVVLVEPEIPPNTGNVIRLCANTGARLHLVKPLGFRLDARAVRRSGLDYHELADVVVHDSFADCLASMPGRARWFAFSTKGDARHDQVDWREGDLLVFGPETRGLSQEILAACPASRRLRIPMQPAARSLNLSNAVAVAVYEAWRQLGYPGGIPG
jgi:tRNA (cytidine/uridine-2'-O-)-methyltransferase